MANREHVFREAGVSREAEIAPSPTKRKRNDCTDTPLETARRSTEFILALRPDEEHFWPRSLSRQGEPLQPSQPPGHNDLYGDCFIAAGIAAVARALGNDEYREVARQILGKCVRLYDRDDFCPDDQSWLGDDAPTILSVERMLASSDRPLLSISFPEA